MDAKIRSELDQITKQLDTISEMMAWLIMPDSRFTIGQRVEWSRKGRKSGFPRRKCAQKGTVKAIDGFSITVRMDGIKHPDKYHHAFFNPVKGEKLF
jgi:hypothetical protein